MRTGVHSFTVTAVILVVTAVVSASADSASTPISSPPPTPAAAPPVAFATWQRSDLPDPAPHAYGGGTPTALVAFRGGFIAVGSVIGACCDGGNPLSDRGVEWTSRDARHWTLHDPIEAFAHATVKDVVTDGRTLVAIGQVAAPRPVHPWDRLRAAWASTDGRTWARAEPPIPTIVAARPHGFIGEATTDRRNATILESADGLTWTPLADLPDARNVCCMAADDSGSMIALGRVPAKNPDGSASSDAVMWASPDGVSWSGPTLLAPSTDPVAVTAAGDGFIAIGSGIGSTPDAMTGYTAGLLWEIKDGVPVVLSELPLGSEGGFDDVFVSGPIVIATGEESPEDDAPNDAVVWVSVDGGHTFGRVPNQPAFSGINNAVRSLVETPTGIVGVGSYWETETLHPPPVMWFSSPSTMPAILPGASRAHVE